jgi:hypothetical protein
MTYAPGYTCRKVTGLLSRAARMLASERADKVVRIHTGAP